jgi:succinyl-diaminopimelate desuccinylase
MNLTLSQQWTQTLVQKKTTQECIAFLKQRLDLLGFQSQILTFHGVTNLYAERNVHESTNAEAFGHSSCKALGFLGHVDVVPVGTGWTKDPFSGVIQEESIFGRGASDMKGAIACFLEALEENSEILRTLPLIFLISGDEEGSAEWGTPAVLKALQETACLPELDFVLIGEPTAHKNMGDVIKVGCRGSLNVTVRVEGVPGHVAYRDDLENPATVLVHYLHELKLIQWDCGDEFFGTTNLEITKISADGEGNNIVPAVAFAQFNIRFNSHVTADFLISKIKSLTDRHSIPSHQKNAEQEARSTGSEPYWAYRSNRAPDRRTRNLAGSGDNRFSDKHSDKQSSVAWNFEIDISCEPFSSSPSPLWEDLRQAIQDVTFFTPRFSAQGGNSDAKFLKELCPFAELGLRVDEAHKPDEKASLQDLAILTKIYSRFLQKICHNQR